MKGKYLAVGVLAAASYGLLGVAMPSSAQPGSVGYEIRRVAGVRAHVVTVNLNDRDVQVTLTLARDGIGSAEPFSSMIHRTTPDAAITGTFFGVKCLLPIGNLVCDGELLYPVKTGTTLAITRDNRAVLVPTKAGELLDWSEYSTGIFAGPTLVRDGKYAVAPWAEGFTDPGHYRHARRTAAGIKANNKLLLVAVPQHVTLTRMAAIMKALGARDAVALDGGTSAALYYRGSTIVRPGRKLTNVIAVYANGRPERMIAGGPAPAG
ncbi:MAG: phosphodiester glycosidase family protein [Armatimonadota bacterium]|nr:MAG: phosphodiester glycosidase family protein [Armatimonadota bacterium]